jgi:hypothetical protein
MVGMITTNIVVACATVVSNMLTQPEKEFYVLTVRFHRVCKQCSARFSGEDFMEQRKRFLGMSSSFTATSTVAFLLSVAGVTQAIFLVLLPTVQILSAYAVKFLE